MRSFRRDIPLMEQVGDNDWSALPYLEFGEWDPRLSVGVVLPAFENQEQVDRALLGLGRQTYPSDRLRVVVVDDGSREPLTVPPRLGDLEVITAAQENQGFRAGTARNLGTRECESEIVIFLDSDMYPEPQFVEAHARWHHLIDFALVVGARKHAHLKALTRESVEASGDSIENLVGPGATPDWIERLLDGTDDFRHTVGSFTPEGRLTYRELWRGVSSGNLSVRADTFWQVGGFREYGEWGGEDNEFGYRATNDGAIVIMDRQAMAWHDGESTSGRDQDRTKIAKSQARLSLDVPSPSLRKEPGATYPVPMVNVELEVTSEPRDQVLEAATSLLEGHLRDLHIEIRTPSGHPDAERMASTYQDEPRVGTVTEEIRRAPYVLATPPLRFGANTLEQLIRMPPDTGVLRISTPGLAPAQCPTFTSERAVARCRRLGWDARVEGFRGVYKDEWVSGAALGVSTTVAGG